MEIYNIIGAIYFFLALLLWLYAFYLGIGYIIVTIRLRCYVKKKYPQIRYNIYPFLDEPLSYFYKCQLIFFKTFITFGDRKNVEKWFNVFFDVYELKKIRNNIVRKYLEKSLYYYSRFIKVFIIFIIFIITPFLLIGFLKIIALALELPLLFLLLACSGLGIFHADVFFHALKL